MQNDVIDWMAEAQKEPVPETIRTRLFLFKVFYGDVADTLAISVLEPRGSTYDELRNTALRTLETKCIERWGAGNLAEMIAFTPLMAAKGNIHYGDDSRIQKQAATRDDPQEPDPQAGWPESEVPMWEPEEVQKLPPESAG